MSVQSVQLHGLEQVVPPVRSASTAGDHTQPAGVEQDQGAAEPHDSVVVSDQARQLAAGTGFKPQDRVELKLDFRKLRELASSNDKSAWQA